MSDDKINLSRRKVLGGLATLGAAGAASGAGTFALFSDTEQSSNNTIQAGTLDLTPGSQTSITFGTTGFKPGEARSGSVTLKKSGSLAGDHVEVAVSSLAEPSGEANEDLTDSSDTTAATDATINEFAQNVYVERFGYGQGYSGGNSWWHDLMPTTQLPGAFDISNTSPYGVGSGVDIKSVNGGINVTSNGAAVNDYVHIAQDVSSADVTLGSTGNIGSNDITFDAEGKTGNDVNVPDELKVIARQDGETRYFYKSTSDPSSTRTVDYTVDPTSGWTEIDVTTGEFLAGTGVSDLTDSDLDGATLELFGLGLGAIQNPTAKTFNMRFSNLTVGDTSISFESTPPTLVDLKNRSYIVDDLMVPTNTTDQTLDFQVRLGNVGNKFQGDGVEFSLDFALAQESGQNVL